MFMGHTSEEVTLKCLSFENQQQYEKIVEITFSRIPTPFYCIKGYQVKIM